MKKVLLLGLMAILIFPTMVFAGSVEEGTVYYGTGHFLEGEVIPMGFDMFGYNYDEYMFRGKYINVYLGREGYPPYTGDDESYLALYPEIESHSLWEFRNDTVLMKWNDAWLSNEDRDEDGDLDRHWGHESYVDSGAWLTNHIKENGKGPQYFIKIKAVEETDILMGDTFYRDEIELGPEIWGSFYEAQVVDKGLIYKSPWGAELE